MKKFLATTAVMLIATTGAASAQSVLERVLGSLDAATTTELNGTFANIAENIGGNDVTYLNEAGVAFTEAEFELLVDDTLGQMIDDGYVFYDDAEDSYYYEVYNGATLSYDVYEIGSIIEAKAFAEAELLDSTFTREVGLGGIVDGSITNVIEGVTSAIADASQSATAGLDTVAYEFNLPTYDLGALSTTALGAVNTGDITLGVNSTVDDAKTTSTQAVSSVMEQLGGSSGTGALVLNIASNMTGVDGSITNTMNNVNGALESASTTALGAVNTGTITSGVNAAVQGIVGTSGQSGL
jgi:hypothetical protein